VELPLFYANVPSGQSAKMAREALGKVGLGDRIDHKPDELSGGQQQRVAIARALVNQPSILLADEPTGALDTATGEDVMALFNDLNEQGITLIVVTHDHDVAAQAARIITLKDGEIIGDERNRETATPNGRMNGRTVPEIGQIPTMIEPMTNNGAAVTEANHESA